MPATAALQHPNLGDFPNDWELDRIEYAQIPSIEEARESDFVLLVGVFDNVGWARQIAGLLDRVIPEGKVLIVAKTVPNEPCEGPKLLYDGRERLRLQGLS